MPSSSVVALAIFSRYRFLSSYLDRNPDKRNLAAAALVVAAMDEAWCPQAPAAPNVHFKTH
jgi:hypothetical protein